MVVAAWVILVPHWLAVRRGVRGGGAGVRVNALYNGCVVIMPIFSVA